MGNGDDGDERDDAAKVDDDGSTSIEAGGRRDVGDVIFRLLRGDRANAETGRGDGRLAETVPV